MTAKPDPECQTPASSIDHIGKNSPRMTAPVKVHARPNLRFCVSSKGNPPYINHPQGVSNDISNPSGYTETMVPISCSLPGERTEKPDQLIRETTNARTGPASSQKTEVLIEVLKVAPKC